MRRHRVLLVSGLLLALLMLAVSALPTQTKYALHTQGSLHIWLHVVGFSLLAFLVISTTRSDLWRVMFIIVLLLFGYATEANESHWNGWGVETNDVRSDSIGVLCGTVLSLLLFPKHRS